MPEDAEMLFLGHCFPRLRERVNAWWVHGGACCTHGYIISWHGALRVLAAIDPLAAPIDEVLRILADELALSVPEQPPAAACAPPVPRDPAVPDVFEVPCEGGDGLRADLDGLLLPLISCFFASSNKDNADVGALLAL